MTEAEALEEIRTLWKDWATHSVSTEDLPGRLAELLEAAGYPVIASLAATFTANDD